MSVTDTEKSTFNIIGGHSDVRNVMGIKFQGGGSNVLNKAARFKLDWKDKYLFRV